MMKRQTATNPPSTAVHGHPDAPTRRAWPLWLRRSVTFAALFLSVATLWQGLKFIAGDPWRIATPFGEFVHRPPFRLKIASDLNMPHLWEIGAAFVNPATRNGPPLVTVLAEAALYTFGEALLGFVMGALFGLLLGILFAHSTWLERGLIPYVVASQTVPIIAIAPMVVIWLQNGWLSDSIITLAESLSADRETARSLAAIVPVAVISAYLTFFPVTINTLRGLRSPDPAAIELMRSLAASTWQILWKVRLPAALPAIFTALKISATASVVGAIIGELPSGIRNGLGGAILNFNQYYISAPERLWATIIASAFVGIGFFLIVRLTEMVVLRGRLGE